MTTPARYAAEMQAAISTYAAMAPRTLQATIGASDIGKCYSAALYKLTGVEPTDSPAGRQALHGNELHKMFAAARAAMNPKLLHEVALTITLPSGLQISGHADEIGTDEVTDWKTVADEGEMRVLRREGSDAQQRFQRHLYYLGAHQAGLVGPVGIVRNWWCDRSGQTVTGHVEQEPFDMAVVHEADNWLQSVLYAAEHGEEVPRSKHADWCARFCEFYTHCRGGLTVPDILVTDEQMVQAARRVFEGRELEKEGKALVETGRRALAPLQESMHGDVGGFLVGDFRVRHVRVNRDEGPSWRLSVERVP